MDTITNDSMVLVGGMSRSGTTLLTAVLDAHPEIACGAELLPAHMPSLADAISTLDSALAATNGDFSEVGRYLRRQGDRDSGLFLVRCYRAGVTHEEVRDALVELESQLPNGAKQLGERLLVAQAIMRRRAVRESAVSYGFKITTSAPNVAQAYLPNTAVICIIRDPRDVILSHQKREFDRTVGEISKTWLAYAKRYRQFEAQKPERCMVIRYEDLTRQPRRTLMKVFEILPVDLKPEVFEFYRSDSPIHAGFHPNAERLRMNFSTDGIGLGAKKLSREELQEIELICGDELANYGYEDGGLVRKKRATSAKSFRIGRGERKLKSYLFSRKRKFAQDEYTNLLAPYRDEYEILSIGDYVREEEIGDRKILMIRHDVDHDLDNAMKIAEWETERGLRTTYCLLHTEWYYGRLEGNRYKHSNMLIDGIARLAELGHEINLHNNLVTLTLTHGIDPIEVLKSELDFYDSLGVPVTGTSTHGDPLCRKLNYRNWELFKECCDDRFGGPRTVENGSDGKVFSYALGCQSMFDLGLEYEAYDIGKDVYHTESGGNLRERQMTKSRRRFGRKEQNRGSVCGVLTHPVWWDFR
jgi:hypothetical protein